MTTKQELERISSEWNGEEAGVKEERAHIAEEKLSKLKDEKEDSEEASEARTYKA